MNAIPNQNFLSDDRGCSIIADSSRMDEAAYQLVATYGVDI